MNETNLFHRIASYFVPAILVLAVCTFIVWYCLSKFGVVSPGDHKSETFALLFSLSILVVSCPCAIGLAVPTAVVSFFLFQKKWNEKKYNTLFIKKN